MSNKKTYTVTSPIKHGGKRYKPGSTISLTEAEAKGLHVEAVTASSGRPVNGRPFTKQELMAETKAFTEGLLKNRGVPEQDWNSLNKEPLIDFYLGLHQPED